MRQQIATVVGLGLSGVPYSGSDTGGFSGDPGDELYIRWLQMSVCMAYCRTHSVLGVPRREPWCWPEPTRAVVAAWIRFRYRLLPYLYTLAHEATATGAPLQPARSDVRSWVRTSTRSLTRSTTCSRRTRKTSSGLTCRRVANSPFAVSRPAEASE